MVSEDEAFSEYSRWRRERYERVQRRVVRGCRKVGEAFSRGVPDARMLTKEAWIERFVDEVGEAMCLNPLMVERQRRSWGSIGSRIFGKGGQDMAKRELLAKARELSGSDVVNKPAAWQAFAERLSRRVK